MMNKSWFVTVTNMLTTRWVGGHLQRNTKLSVWKKLNDYAKGLTLVNPIEVVIPRVGVSVFEYLELINDFMYTYHM